MLDLEHLAEAALAKLSDDVPLPEYGFIFFVIARIHACTSLLLLFITVKSSGFDLYGAAGAYLLRCPIAPISPALEMIGRYLRPVAVAIDGSRANFFG